MLNIGEIPQEHLSFIINHVFLPPKLPSRADEHFKDGNVMFLKSLLWAMEQFQNTMVFNTQRRDLNKLTTAVRMMRNMCELETGDALQLGLFSRTIMGMREDDMVVLHIAAQNAGLYIRRSGPEYIFASFEASPKSSAVITTAGKLLCSYPGPCIAVPEHIVWDKEFLGELGSFLEKMKRDVLQQAAEHAMKAGAMVGEQRETVNPKFITEMLTGILRAVGKPMDVDRIQKRVGDDVIWDNSMLPWRRSPLWLVVKVCLQLTISYADYKAFVVFFMSHLLDKAVRQGLPGDILHFMNSKITRRVLKVDGDLPKFVLDSVKEANENARRLLTARWNHEISAYRRPFVWNPQNLDVRNDMRLRMAKSRTHLIHVKNMRIDTPDRNKFEPKENIRIPWLHGSIPSLTLLKDPNITEAHLDLTLADFECWVERNLERWLVHIMSSSEAYRTGNLIAERVQDYVNAAGKRYASSPEKMSKLILTSMELWIALDKWAVRICPLLTDYYPMFTSESFRTLLLPHTSDVERLTKLEDYLHERSSKATFNGMGSIYSDTITEASFVVRYFDSSPDHQELEEEILERAARERAQRKQQYEHDIRIYESKLEVARDLACEYFTHREEGWTRHDYKCKKCTLIKDARGMRIEIHEWPLPEKPLQRKAVVFELRCPVEYSIWRDLTFRLLCDLGYPPTIDQGSKQQSKNIPRTLPREELDTYQGLKMYFKDVSRSRPQEIRWSSYSKSFSKSHYRLRSTTSRDDICLPHALNYGLFDSKEKVWSESRGMSDLVPVCTFRLPDGPYKKLQYAIRSSIHEPNIVMTRQSECPGELSVHEYIAFGLLRAGTRIQWRNILRELRTRTLTFGNENVAMLLMQTVWQAGPRGRSNDCRQAHEDLRDHSFGEALIRELEISLEGIDMNWQEAGAVHVFSILAIRLVTMSPWNDVVDRAVSFLRKARRVTLCWARELSLKLPDSKPGEMRDSQLRVVQLAAICRSTFNIEKKHLDKLLETSEDVSIAVECATMIHQNETIMSSNSTLHRTTRALIDRDIRLRYMMGDRLRKLIVTDFGIDLSPVWGGYHGGAPWKALPAPNDSWVVTRTQPTGENQSHEVHYNLISGRLLVQGLPLGRMTSHYTTHKSYFELFGEKVLDVYPSTMKGMAFQTKVTSCGYEIHFAMSVDNDLIIRTRRESDYETIHHFVPRAVFSEDFPVHILEEHHYWYELRLDRIDLRDVGSPWATKTPSWHVANALTPSPVMYLGDDENLIDGNSVTAKMVHEVLEPLEYPRYMDIRYSRFNKAINIHLPRLKLDFYFKSNTKNLYCRQFTGLVVDDNQDIGTLVGLQNRLVMKKGDKQSVIIPHGKLKVSKFQTHVAVEIDTQNTSTGRVKYHLYHIDTILGRLVGNGSLLSHLHLVSLHAVTSNSMPDPLTNRTGTEEALAGLKTAASWSFQNIEPYGPEAEIFRYLADLTPKRLYYPTHLKVMQMVTWNSSLSFLTQHDSFHTTIDAISKHTGRFHIFFEGNSANAEFYRSSCDMELLERASIRNSSFRGGIEEKLKPRDVTYSARDVFDKRSREGNVHQVASLVIQKPPRFQVCKSLLKVFEEWKLLKGKSGEKNPLVIGYDLHWLGLTDSLRDDWCPLYEILSKQENFNHYQLVFLLSTFAFVGNINLDLIGTLLAVAIDPEFPTLELPNYIEYDLTEGYEPEKEMLVRAIKECLADLEERMDIQQKLQALQLDDMIPIRAKVSASSKKELDYQARDLARGFTQQWPCNTLNLPEGSYTRLDKSAAMERVLPFFKNWYRNLLFSNYVDDVQSIVDGYALGTEENLSFALYNFKPQLKPPSVNNYREIGLNELFQRKPPKHLIPPEVLGSGDYSKKINQNSKDDITAANGKTGEEQLRILLQDFRGRRLKDFHNTYVDTLENSLKALEKSKTENSGVSTVGIEERQTLEYWTRCQSYLDRLYRSIKDQLVPKGDEITNFLCYNAGMWPSISPITLLQQLAKNSADGSPLSAAWKKVIVEYGKAITHVQRAHRINKFLYNPTEFSREISNLGHSNWNPIERPDWLLMEIENDMLIREVQADIAAQMLNPPKNENAIVQLLMGEGKTSVVTPIVASALADGSSLVRVIVLKPLSTQMHQMLVQRLGGLLNRRIFFMPFSRSVKMGLEEARLIQEVLEDCMRTRGILLAQPEHVLSFKLLGLEWLHNAKTKFKGVPKKTKSKDDKPVPVTENKYTEIAEILVNTQQWLEKTSRDILDESDEILNVKHELIYSIGNSTPIQNHPDRWIVIQEVFDLIHDYFKNKENYKHNEFEVGSTITDDPARFPLIRFLREQPGLAVLKKLAIKIVSDGLPAINFRFLSPEKRRIAEEFIADSKIDQLRGETLLTHCGQMDNDISTATLVLLRGLFSHHILRFILGDKRWKVDYGLDLRRTMLAVPYRAKDSPAGRAEFSHPDVAIALTCLSYYYGGLTEEQLDTCFRNLFKSDNPTMQYERWIRGAKLPNKSFRNFSSINLEDRKQWAQIIEIFKFNKSVIDFYLAGVVFPREAKEFKHKLSTSGWDLAAEKTYPTTGFSGTNDNRFLLPLGITQHDRDAQLNTNAQVLCYLLQPENCYVAMEEVHNERLDFMRILKTINEQKELPVRVLLDVGAQVLELRNEEVAQTWLDNSQEVDVDAAVYFDENDVIMVLTRDGIREPLMVSEFSGKMKRCVVYLDEAHTRGTDLKLPEKSRAAVTLGPSLTKDRLVQACMRMRKLGQGHSVLFCAPLEIQRKLKRIALKQKRETIEVRDIIFWSMDQTCVTYKKLLPIWTKQGVSYQKRAVATNKLYNTKVMSFQQDFLEKEAKSLLEHYGFDRLKHDSLKGWHPARQYRRQQFKLIEEKCATVAVSTYRGAPMMEEQEQEQQRELYHEIECEREDERPPRAGPARHSISDAVLHVVREGKLPVDQSSLVPAFQVFLRTTAPNCDPNSWSQKLLATTDFMRVIESNTADTDNFLRPVNWVLSSLADPTFFVIISPYEANHLLPEIQRSKNVLLHMYSPRVTKDSESYEALDFCTMPSKPLNWSPPAQLVDQLNIFAGQLYLRDMRTYQRLLGFLGLYLNENLDPRIADFIGSDGFVGKHNRDALGMRAWSPFTRSPVLFLRALVGLRRRGASYLATHMGQVLHGRPLKNEDFEDV